MKQTRHSQDEIKSSERKQWYLLAYDIRNPKRLNRVHYFVKKKGVGLQRSVYLLRANKQGVDEVASGIKQRVKDNEDDVRLYPVQQPGSIWAAGLQAAKLESLYAPAVKNKNTTGKGFFAGIKRLFSRGK